MSTLAQSTVGVIGAGNMGGAIARGLVESGALPATSLVVADPDDAKRAAFEAIGVAAVATQAELVARGTDVVVLAVKPQILGGVMASVADALAGRLVVSIAAGVPLATIQAALPTSRVVRVMPNLPAQVRSGATAVAPGASATPEDAALVKELFDALGTAVVMREDQLDVSGAVVGTAPAFFALFVDTLTRAGVRAGLPAADCRALLETTMRGVAQQLLDEGAHPREYMDRVTSPGGTTAAALRELECPLFEASDAAVQAALERTRELAG